jgi:hypothetical protein
MGKCVQSNQLFSDSTAVGQGACKRASHLLLMAAALAGLASVGVSHAGSVNFDFTTGATPTGVTLNGGAYITNDHTGLHLADNTVFSTTSTLVLDDLDAGATITGFTADFDILIGNGTSGNADGFSFTFGPSSGDVSSGASFGEEGGSGDHDFVVEFDTYNNGTPDNIGIDLKQSGTEIVTGPQFDLSFIYQTSFVHCSIVASNDTSVTVVYNNKIVYTNFPGAFLATQGQFALGGRTGNAAEDCWLENLKITTSTTKATLPFFTSTSPANGASGTAPNATLTAVINDGTSTTVNKSSITLAVDGTDVTSSSTITQAGGTNTVAYTPKTLFASNSQHNWTVAFKDSGGASYTKTFSFTVAKFATLTKDLAVTGDTSKPGFLFNYFQNEDQELNGGQFAANSIYNIEQAWAGNWVLTNNVDATVLGSATSVTKPSTPTGFAQFVVPTVINMDKAGGSNGHFTPEDQMPGTPGVTSASNGQLTVSQTYLNLPAGILTMGVTSDDGFRVYAGNVNDLLARQNAGEADVGRGAADTTFAINVVDAGVYPFILEWENGTGGANVSWFTLKSDGTPVLVGDTANGGVAAYRAATSATPPAITSVNPYPKDAYPVTVSSLKDSPLDGAVNLVQLTIQDGSSATVDKTSVVLSVDGAPVTATVAQASGKTTVTYNPTTHFADASDHVGTIVFKDSTGAARTNSWNFHVGHYTSDTLFIEAEDWDYGHGKYLKTGVGMDGPYVGGSYVGLGDTADDPFDYHVDETAPAGTPPWYRANVFASPGKVNGSALNGRGSFKVGQWWALGWNDAGNWQNYTRDFPAAGQTYNVFAHLASGGSPIALQLDQITAGQGQTDASQTKQKLGVFQPGRATAGWDVMEVFQLTKDTNGTPATVTLKGTSTLRLTLLPGANADEDYLAFVPASGGGGGGGSFSSVKVSADGKSLILTYTGTLQSSATVNGTYAPVSGASSPYTAPITGSEEFFRVQ